MWISVEDRLPEPKTPVLIVLNGSIRVGELVWEHPEFEDSYKSFTYWDCPFDDGKMWEWFQISHWMPIPELPQLSKECL